MQEYIYAHTYFQHKNMEGLALSSVLITLGEIACFLIAIWYLITYIRRPSQKPHKTLLSFQQLLPEYKGSSTTETVSESFANLQPAPSYHKSSYKYIDTLEKLESSVASLQCEPVVGIDVENDSSHSYLGSICLIQLSTPSFTYLIDTLSLPSSAIVAHLGPILANANIVKVFHDCRSDLLWLKRDYPGISIANVFDTHYFAKLLGVFTSLGLEQLWKHYCNFDMAKEEKKKFQRSDWSVRPLSPDQMEYAAIDSFYLIYLRKAILKELLEQNGLEFVVNALRELQDLVYERQNLKATEHSQEGWIKEFKTKVCALTETSVISEKVFEWIWGERNKVAKKKNVNVETVCTTDTLLRISLHLPNDVEALQKYLTENIPPSEHSFILSIGSSIIQEIAHNSNAWKADPESMKNASKIMRLTQSHQVSLAERNKAIRRERARKKYISKRPKYENCKIYGPEGKLLSHCDKKKLNWYTSKNLAEIISEDPLSIRLFFTPHKEKSDPVKGVEDDLFELDERKNICVVCGSGQTLNWYHIIPIIYWQELPERHRSHRSHDIVLLCLDCHEKAVKYVNDTMKGLSEKYKVPLVDKEMREYMQNVIKAKTSANAFKKYATRFNEATRVKREESLISLVQRIQEVDSNWESVLDNGKLTDKVLDVIISKPTPTESKNMHGAKVVQQIEDLEEFIKMWRKKFLERMDPQYMPKRWSVDHRVDRTFGKLSTFNSGKQFTINNYYIHLIMLWATINQSTKRLFFHISNKA
eukprot:TRINITY_DN47_c0_g2_i14.p1 TRINITY_DN47_c0_g2~~TRINITY_DN47_c0_g2_i14.p1  ORF type:complete len:758 (-),score=54.79 TRINITY_DN47_c0_g2_i14:3031-5304(-)